MENFVDRETILLEAGTRDNGRGILVYCSNIYIYIYIYIKYFDLYIW